MIIERLFYFDNFRKTRIMKTLYIFPHPDDESFGPAPVIYRQTNNGEEVHLLTLTKGGATKQRFKYNLSIEQMGDVRVKEMHAVSEVLNLTSMTILDHPDGGMAKMNPIDLETEILSYIERIKPDIVVTYPIHGISGHPDHLTIHAILKRLFCQTRNNSGFTFWKRLAFFTLPRPDDGVVGGNSHVNSTSSEDINCIVKLNNEEQQKLKETLFCYESYIDVIEETGVIEKLGYSIHFEFYNEDVHVNQLSEKL